MKNLFLILSTIFSFNSAALALEDGWTQVVATTLGGDQQSPHYRDILIHHPDTYSEVKVVFGSDAIVDRFDLISFILWGTQVPELTGYYSAGEEHTALFKPTKVKFVRIYVRAKHSGQPLPVRVWMR